CSAALSPGSSERWSDSSSPCYVGRPDRRALFRSPGGVPIVRRRRTRRRRSRTRPPPTPDRFFTAAQENEMRNLPLSLFAVLALAAPAPADDSKPWKAGVAVRVITPSEPMWMAGYGARNKPSEGKVHDLHVKALALEDAAGKRLVLLTSDLVGIPRDLSEA